jgi:hypothetical protein
MSKAVEKKVVIAGISEKDLQKMDNICKEFSIAKISSDSAKNVSSAFLIAEGIKQLHEVITPDMMKPIMYLQGNQLGFLTDKDRDGGYDVKTVKNCCIQALMNGANLAGNEFNIIASKTYFTLNYFIRKVRETEGLTDFDYKIYLKSKDVIPGTTIDVGYECSWNLDGNPMSQTGSIPVRINKAMGADAAIGKARRKMLAVVVNKIQGSEHSIPEGDINDCDIKYLKKPKGKINGVEEIKKALKDDIEGTEVKAEEVKEGNMFDENGEAKEGMKYVPGEGWVKE